ncbi:acyclic terpene utilization AtuA family protein [Streptomyces olivoreticuli]|uniref:acyclic terpene utilization AtuA family protein n=1 Tax=Streptomyces olivoreticuli TaxID=68246 RepID=UPI000E2521C8|nr:acyclic terpene utilization AtuA family protein [Streptomyces olivoreticuli]
MAGDRSPLRVGNASGFYGDRFDALREMLTGGPLDVLTGDYLAEMTMLILGRDRLKNPQRGYAKTFLGQLEEGLGLAVDRGVRLVTNAGGLNPAGLAQEIRALAERVGVPVRVAHVEGDDLLAEREWGPGVLTANAYLGGAGIAACLRAGADVVVTGRVTDAALVTGPATAHFGWLAEDLDRLAGAVVAGHVLECGAQATGGNYSFFREISGPHGVHHPGFPIAEIHADGSAVITKHPGTGGAVTVGTVTAQLLYETAGPRYLGPDVTARLDTVRLTEDGPDRVRIDGVRGEAPPPFLKTGLTRVGGWRNEIVFVLTGLDIEAKAALVREQLEAALARRRPAEVRWTLARTDRADADVQEEASALLRLVVRDPDPEVVGRAVSSAAIQLALASYPGFHVTAPPGKSMPYGVFEAAYIDAYAVRHVAVLPDATRVRIPACVPDGHGPQEPACPVFGDGTPDPGVTLPLPLPPGPTRRVPLGTIAGARSGDKGGSANVGVWVRTDEAWRWLAHELTVDRLRELLPETARFTVERHVLPNLRALNFTVDGLLGEGVASQARFDPQAKALGEWLRARHLEIPEVLL